MRSVWTVLAVLLLVAGCAKGAPAGESEIRTIKSATVTDLQGGNGPILCTGPVAESAPPQCEGPVIANWDWSAVWGASGEKGSRFGEYCLEGRDVDGEFVLTALPRPPGTCGKAEYVASAIVLEDEHHGPQLCLSGIMMSLPIQCDGPDILNWDWDRVDGSNKLNKTIDGSYVVHGTFEGGDFTLTRPPVPPGTSDAVPSPDDIRSFDSPCPEPKEGWFPADRPKLDEGSAERAASFASSLSGYSEAWLDQSHNPSRTMNDDNRTILNVRVTKDAAGTERAMRTVWAGALCVSMAKHTDKELRRIQDDVSDVAGSLTLTTSSGDDHVDIQVIVDEGGTLQKAFDQKYGKGLVRVASALQPAAAGVPTER